MSHSLLGERLRAHRRMVLNWPEVLMRPEATHLASDLAIAAAVVDFHAMPVDRLEDAIIKTTARVLEVIVEAAEMGGVSASKLAEMLGCKAGDLHGSGLQDVANLIYEAASELPEVKAKLVSAEDMLIKQLGVRR